MNLQISATALWGMVEAIDDTLKTEQCAVLYGKHDEFGTHVIAFEFVPNRHPQPESAYRILMSDIAPHHISRIVGVFHTHLEEHSITASELDISLLPDGHVGIVYHVPTGTFTYFDSQKNEGK